MDARGRAQTANPRHGRSLSGSHAKDGAASLVGQVCGTHGMKFLDSISVLSEHIFYETQRDPTSRVRQSFG